MKAFSKNMKNVPNKIKSIPALFNPCRRFHDVIQQKNIESSIFFNIFEIKDFRKKTYSKQ